MPYQECDDPFTISDYKGVPWISQGGPSVSRVLWQLHEMISCIIHKGTAHATAILTVGKLMPTELMQRY